MELLHATFATHHLNTAWLYTSQETTASLQPIRMLKLIKELQLHTHSNTFRHC
jgi:hypothetical protein